MTIQMHAHANDAAQSEARAALLRGGLGGVAIVALALVLITRAGAFALVLVVPAILVQLVLLPEFARSFVLGGFKPIGYLALTYAIPIAGWTLLWRVAEYGSSWPVALALLLGLHAPSILMQAVLLHRCSMRRSRGYHENLM